MPPTQSCEVTLSTSCSKSDTELSKKERKVRFADSMGLSLVSVVYLPTPAPPKARLSPRSWCAFQDLKNAKLLNFIQPLKRHDFNENLNRLNVSLETIVVRDFGVLGTVKVRNLAYHKKVTVRYTVDGWSSCRDVVGQYVEESHAGFTDTFSFEMPIPTTLLKDCKLEFAICYKVLGVEFWDNNSGDNYRLLCFAPSHQWKSRDWLCKYNSLEYNTQNRYVGLRF